MVNRIGREEGEKAGVLFLEADLKKKDGFLKSVETAKRLGIYRQDYCGCLFSKKSGGSVRESNPPETLLPPDRI
jgi:predicted adenine nucleotide alpha hydrolase (AANH) superfamily ATPase